MKVPVHIYIYDEGYLEVEGTVHKIERTVQIITDNDETYLAIAKITRNGYTSLP